jgi:hypothetical protein
MQEHAEGAFVLGRKITLYDAPGGVGAGRGRSLCLGFAAAIEPHQITRQAHAVG